MTWKLPDIMVIGAIIILCSCLCNGLSLSNLFKLHKKEFEDSPAWHPFKIQYFKTKFVSIHLYFIILNPFLKMKFTFSWLYKVKKSSKIHASVITTNYMLGLILSSFSLFSNTLACVCVCILVALHKLDHMTQSVFIVQHFQTYIICCFPPFISGTLWLLHCQTVLNSLVYVSTCLSVDYITSVNIYIFTFGSVQGGILHSSVGLVFRIHDPQF